MGSVAGLGLRSTPLFAVLFAVGCGDTTHSVPDAAAAPGDDVQSAPQADAPGSDTGLTDHALTDDAPGDGPLPISWDGRVTAPLRPPVRRPTTPGV